MATTITYVKRFWSEQDGFIVSAELVLLATILVLALIVGLAEVRSAITSELVDLANAFGRVNQSYKSHGHNSFHDRPFHANVELVSPGTHE